MPQVFGNRAAGTLAAGINAAATSLTLATGNGAKFPAMAAGDTLTAVIQVGELDTDAREYITITARAGDVLTIVRAQEGSAAAAFGIGSVVAAVATAAGINQLVQRDTAVGAAQIPAGSDAQRPTHAAGKFRFNTTSGRWEGSNGTTWGPMGGAVGGGSDSIFYASGKIMTADFVVPTDANYGAFGPLEIPVGRTLEIPAGAVLTIV